MARLFSLVCLVSLLVSACSGPDYEVIEEEQRNGYVCQLIEYEASHGRGKVNTTVRAFLLLPDTAEVPEIETVSPATQEDAASEKSRRNGRTRRKVPGLVLLHDHGARFDIGKEKLVRPLASAPEHIKASSRQWIQSGFDGVYFADSLARLGYAVIVPDALYWGDRSSELCQRWSMAVYGGQAKVQENCSDGAAAAGEEGDSIIGKSVGTSVGQSFYTSDEIKAMKKQVYEGQRAVYDSLQANGIIWAEQTLEEDAAAAKLIASLPMVNQKNIGCFGWSMGAHRAWLLAAFCDEVKTGVGLCWMTMKRTQADPMTASDYSMIIPRLRDEYDFPEIALWLAPKPFLFLSGRHDRLFPAEATQEAYSIINSVYSDKGASGQAVTEFFDGAHHCGKAEQKTIVEFLDNQLKASLLGQ